MNVHKITEELTQKYPGARIYTNNPDNPTEVICDVEPAFKHREYSAQVCVINETAPHYHNNSAHIYYVLKGTLTLYAGEEKYTVKEDEVAIVKPGQMHRALGRETWVELYSEPGLTREDTYTPESRLELPAETAALIELYGNDFAKTKSFYLEHGFTKVWENTEKNTWHLVVSRDNHILYLSNRDENKHGGKNTINIMTTDIEKTHKEIGSGKILKNEWELSYFTIKDPSGNTVKFIESFNILTPR